jgi:shikimate dehydrogenase
MQNAGLAALALNWRYLAFEVRLDNLLAALQGAKAMGFIGVNLTVPHKLWALELVDVVNQQARSWGSVNTVRFEGRCGTSEWLPLRDFETVPEEVRSHGFNTDADAISRALREDLGLELKGKKVLLIGIGGAGRTAALKIASESASELFLVNRTGSKAEAVANEIRERFPSVKLTLGYPIQPVDLIVNATSLGLNQNDSLPLDQSQFSIGHARAVYDMIYRPAETPLLKLAHAAGCRTSNGLSMLLYQGAAALELWTGQPAPLQIMRRALEKNVYG